MSDLATFFQSVKLPVMSEVAHALIHTLNDEDVCVGCGRTLADITGWTKMSEQEKAACVERAQARLRDGRLTP